MATPARRKTAARRQTPEPAPETPALDNSIDGALDRWSDVATRELAAWGIGATTTLLRGMQAMQEAQLEAAREAQRLHEEAAAQLGSARDASELAQIQLALAQSDGRVALQSMSRIGEVATRQALESWNDAAAGFAHMNGATWTAALQWFNGVARQPADAELVEAEVEHVVSPLAASPFVWPAQEAARQALGVAGAAWNDWLSWSNRWAEAATGGAASDRS
jgi:hypothetical protein